jgi:hypothetical protein
VSKMLLNNDATLLKHVDRQGKTVLHHVAHSGKCEDLVPLPPHPPSLFLSLSLSACRARARSPRPPTEAKRHMIEAKGTYDRSKETYETCIRDLLEAEETY